MSHLRSLSAVLGAMEAGSPVGRGVMGWASANFTAITVGANLLLSLGLLVGICLLAKYKKGTPAPLRPGARSREQHAQERGAEVKEE